MGLPSFSARIGTFLMLTFMTWIIEGFFLNRNYNFVQNSSSITDAHMPKCSTKEYNTALLTAHCNRKREYLLWGKE